ncbi:glutamate receptor-like [Penaeus vannamei]|uniref:glutamate receptor-like n=1 Tax=Penaeus vannamei TaxID=6689 RepID=UPI00387FAA9C
MTRLPELHSETLSSSPTITLSSPSSQAVVAEVSSLRPGAEVAFWDVYQPAPHLPQRVTALGKWHVDEPPLHQADLQTSAKDAGGRGDDLSDILREPWDRRTNLTGLVVRCTTLPDNPDGSVKISGIYGDLWDALRESLNFTENCFRPPDGAWGALKDDSWVGMVGQLVRDEADVAVAPLDKTYDRSLVVDYPFPLSLEGYVLVIKRPSGSNSMWNSYLREFTPEAWLLGCAVLVVLALSLTLAMRLSPGDDPVALGDAVMVVVAALCQTGTTMNFNSYSSRIVTIALFLTCVLVYTFYTSFLISALTVNKIMLPFRTLQEMYAKQSYTFGFNGGGSLEGYFKTL